MISLPLLKRNMISCVKTFLIIFALLCMYTIVIIYMYNPELSDMLNDYQDLLPGMMSAVGMTGIATGLLDWIQIYLYGFIMMLFPLVFSIIVVQKLLMSYIDTGSMANLLSTPNSRRKIIMTQALSVILWTAALMVAITVVGIVSCNMMFPDELDVKRYVMLNGSAFLLQFAVCGMVFFTAAIFSEAKNFYALGAGLPILFFLIQMISNMGDKLEELKYFTIYTLFPAAKIVGGEACLAENAALGAIGVVLFGLAIFWFSRRDLSL